MNIFQLFAFFLKYFYLFYYFFTSIELLLFFHEIFILILFHTLVLRMKRYIRNLVCAGLIAVSVYGCGKDDSEKARRKRAEKSAIYAALCSNKLQDVDLELMVEHARAEEALYQVLVDDVVYAIRTNPEKYKDELLDCCATAVGKYGKEAGDIYGFVYAKNALENLGLRNKEGE